MEKVNQSYISEELIKIFKSSKKFFNNLESLDLKVSYKNDDDKFTIEGLVGGIEKMNYGIEKCNSDLNIAASDISKKFKNSSFSST